MELGVAHQSYVNLILIIVAFGFCNAADFGDTYITACCRSLVVHNQITTLFEVHVACAAQVGSATAC